MYHKNKCYPLTIIKERMVFQMKNKKQITLFVSGLLIACCLTGCGTMAALSNHIPAQAMNTGDSISSESSVAMNDVAYARENAENSGRDEAEYWQKFKIYEQFGMTYDAVKQELWYSGKLVRWFEDYYQLDEEESGGIDFFNENGVVDVYAVRDLSNLVQYADGSYDPSGKVVGLKEFSDKEFASRDIDAIKNPLIGVAHAIEGGELTEQEKKEIASEYAAFGVTYDADHGKWYFNGKKVRYFLDILNSNGKSTNGGEFQGAIREWWEDDGVVDIYTVRDFSKLNDDANGVLKAIEECSQQEFDAHTQEEKDGSGYDVQLQDVAVE